MKTKTNIMINESQLPTEIRVKPYSKKELSILYGVCFNTMNKWLLPFEKEIGSRQGRYYSIRQVEMIFKKLGVPYICEIESINLI